MLFRRSRWRCVKIPSFRTGNRHFAQGRQVSRMAEYTKAELANMYLAYEATDCSGPALVREAICDKAYPSHNFFASLHQRLAETISFQRAGKERVRIARTSAIEQNMLQQVQKTPSMSMRSLLHAVKVFSSIIWKLSENMTCTLFTCSVSRHRNRMIIWTSYCF